jgi:hypothetical protein
VDRVVEERLELDRAGDPQRHVVVLPEDRDVDLARAQPCEAEPRVDLDDVDAKAVGADGLGDDRRGRARERGDTNTRLVLARSCARGGLRVCQPGQDRVGALDEHAPGGGQVDAAAAPLEDLVAEVALERAQLL